MLAAVLLLASWNASAQSVFLCGRILAGGSRNEFDLPYRCGKGHYEESAIVWHLRIVVHNQSQILSHFLAAFDQASVAVVLGLMPRSRNDDSHEELRCGLFGYAPKRLQRLQTGKCWSC